MRQLCCASGFLVRLALIYLKCFFVMVFEINEKANGQWLIASSKKNMGIVFDTHVCVGCQPCLCWLPAFFWLWPVFWPLCPRSLTNLRFSRRLPQSYLASSQRSRNLSIARFGLQIRCSSSMSILNRPYSQTRSRPSKPMLPFHSTNS